jgi:purine-nucleoside phosphorylase
MTPFDTFRRAVEATAPRAAVVLGSGLADAAAAFTATASVPYAAVPGLVPPTVAGHRGRLAVGHWGAVPVVVCSGRIHFYEGHPWERVTRLVELVAGFGVNLLVLTNAAGGIRDDLHPGELMAVRGHLKLLDAGGWKRLTPLAPAGRGAGGGGAEPPYSLLAASLPTGVYAALTGPCYETPAEIRALRAMGADAVGMSTAVEAEAAAAVGLTVAAVSCITNKAAGLSPEVLSHQDVERTAKTAVARLAAVLGRLIAGGSGASA